MRWRRVLCGGAMALIAVSASALDTLALDGWHPCSVAVVDGSSSGSNDSSGVQGECATVTMPLCHGDVCSDTENRTVELYVKRLPATSASSTRNFWFFPDHTWAMSAEDAERQMVLLHQELLGDVNVYLMDQRGTGRGTLLDCEATSPTSPQGVLVAPSEAASCADALRATFGDNFAAAFSLTSAARDVVTFISTFQAQTKVFLYGVGFGTLLVERMMHFPSEEIIGFVVDSTATTSGAKKKEFPYRSRTDKDFGAVFKSFLAVCDDDDGACSRRFDGTKLADALEQSLNAIDATNATCGSVSKALRSVSPDEPASYSLRRLLAEMLQQIALRPFIPVVIFRLQRCNPSDVDVLTAFMDHLQTIIDTQVEAFKSTAGAGAAMLVYDLIVFSEMWEDPPPSRSELLGRFTKTLASHGVAFRELERYCAFTQDATTACSDFNATKSVLPLSYARDANWNTPSKIKDQASVLFLTSRFDGNAPLSYAQTLLDALEGDDHSKQLLVFDAAAHNVLVQTPTTDAAEARSLDAARSCSRTVVASFVDNDGDLSALDTACMAQLPTNTSLVTVSEALSMFVLGITDAYDGVLPVASGSGSDSAGSGVGSVSERPAVAVPHQNSSADTSASSLEASRNRYRTAFIVLLVLVVVLLVVVVLLLYRAHRKRQLEHEELQLRKLRGEEEDDMEFLRDLYNPSPSEWFNYRSNRVHL